MIAFIIRAIARLGGDIELAYEAGALRWYEMEHWS